MPTFVFSNNVSTTLADPVASDATTITLSSAANLPTIPPGDYWPLTLNDVATGTYYEILYVTAISGATLTVLRGQEATTALTWDTGDYAFSGVTAGSLGNFFQGGGEFVELSPGAAQDGFINVTGAITGGGEGSFAGVAVGGALSDATTGDFSEAVTAEDFIATLAYGATILTDLAIQLPGSTGLIGIGPSSGLTQEGVTASALAIGVAASPNFITFDIDGNIGLPGSLSAGVALYAPEIFQNGTQVISDITSPDDSVTVDTTGSSVTLKIGTGFVGQTIEVQAVITPTQVNDEYTLTLPEPLPTGNWSIQMICSGFGLATGSQDIELEGSGGTFPSSASLNGNANSRTLFIAGSAVSGQTPAAVVGGIGVTYAAGSSAIFLVITATRTS